MSRPNCRPWQPCALPGSPGGQCRLLDPGILQSFDHDLVEIGRRVHDRRLDLLPQPQCASPSGPWAPSSTRNRTVPLADFHDAARDSRGRQAAAAAARPLCERALRSAPGAARATAAWPAPARPGPSGRPVLCRSRQTRRWPGFGPTPSHADRAPAREVHGPPLARRHRQSDRAPKRARRYGAAPLPVLGRSSSLTNRLPTDAEHWGMHGLQGACHRRDTCGRRTAGTGRSCARRA